MLRITVAQLNYMVGDIAGNVAQMIAAARQAAQASADLVVFSELSLTGYYPGDLLDEPEFLARTAQGLEALREASREFPTLHWIVGTPLPREGVGKRLQNALVVLRAGEVLLRYAKQLLPTYNIFDELRHFAPGPDVARVLRIGQAQVGLMICEDGWNDSGVDYAVNPFLRLADAAPDLVVSINASPSEVGKREMRHQIFGAACRRHGLPLLYVNQVGGQDQVVFDGASFAVDPAAGVCFEARRFAADVTTLRFDEIGFHAEDGGPLPAVHPQGLSTLAFYQAQIVLGLRDYARRCGFTRAVIGSSGGIDSALTLALAVEALGADNVAAITMPSVYSSAGSVDDSKTLCDNLGIRLDTHPIAATVAAFAAQFENSFGRPLAGLPLENLQARARHDADGVLERLRPPAAHHGQQVGNLGRLLHALRRHQRRPRADRRPLQDRGLRAVAPCQRGGGARADPARDHRQGPIGRTRPRPARHRQPAALPGARRDPETADRRRPPRPA